MNEVKGKNRFCGPATLSAITGITTDEASRLIRWFSGQRSVTGTSCNSMRQALRHLGYWKTKIEPMGKTLNQHVQKSRSLQLILVTGHYVVSDSGLAIDSKNRKPTFIDEFKGKKARVKKCWEIRKCTEAKPIPTVAELVEKHPHISRTGRSKSKVVEVAAIYVDPNGDGQHRDWLTPQEMQDIPRYLRQAETEQGWGIIIATYDQNQDETVTDQYAGAVAALNAGGWY